MSSRSFSIGGRLLVLILPLFLLPAALPALHPAHAATPAASPGASPGTASAAQPEIRLQAWRIRTVVEQARVQELREPLRELRPGDVVEYEARYVNGTSKPVRDVQLTLPVPAGGLELLALDAMSTPARWASVDGRRFEPIPLRREQRRADGRVTVEAVPLSEYRYLRWQLGDLPAGAERSVSARMQLPPLAGAAR